MNKFREFAQSTRKELLLEIIFTLFGFLIKDDFIRLIVLVAGFTLSSVMVYAKPKINGNISIQFKLLLEWVVIAGASYLLVPYLWILGIKADLNPLVLFGLTFVIMTLPIIILGKKHRDNDNFPTIIGFAWLAGAIGTYLLVSTQSNLYYVVSPLLGLAIISTVFAPKGGLWFIVNLAAGGVYTYIYTISATSSSDLAFLPILLASITSAMMTGLSYVILFETQN